MKHSALFSMQQTENQHNPYKEMQLLLLKRSSVQGWERVIYCGSSVSYYPVPGGTLMGGHQSGQHYANITHVSMVLKPSNYLLGFNKVLGAQCLREQ